MKAMRISIGLTFAVIWLFAATATAQTADDRRAQAYRMQTGTDDTPIDLVAAVTAYRMAADAGNSTANNDLGWCYEHGLGIKADSVQAFNFYMKAAGNNDPYGCYNAARCLLQGLGTSRNVAEGATLLAKAAQAGNPMAQLTLAYYRLYAEHDSVAAARLFQQAAQSGLPLAQYALGCCLKDGTPGIAKDAEKAAEWWKKAANANPHAAYNLAVCYDEGYGVPRDSAQAMKLYLNAAKQGQPLAQCRIGQLMLNDDPDQALQWLTKAYDENNNLSAVGLRGVHLYKQLTYDFVVDEQEYDDAFDDLSKAVEQEEHKADISPEVLRLLAACYDYGRGTEPDSNRAEILRKQAALNGDTIAQVQVGQRGKVYRRSTLPGPQRLMATVRFAIGDKTQAGEDLFRAAQSGDAKAQYLVGMAHYADTSDKLHYTKAVPWLRVAAQNNYAPAVYAMAQCRLLAHGITRNTADGLSLLQRAALLGYRPACLQLAQIYTDGKYGQQPDNAKAQHYTFLAEQGITDLPNGFVMPDNTCAQQPIKH